MESALGHRTVTHAAVSAFGGMTGDRARLHFDHHFGRAHGGPIAHGLLNACWAVGALTLHASERMGINEADAVFGEFSLRLQQVVKVGDTLCLRVSDATNADAAAPAGASAQSSAFETLNQEGVTTSSGQVTIWRGGAQPGAAPEIWELEAAAPRTTDRTLYAEDMLEAGPRGVSAGRTLTESDVVAFATEVGELNPSYLNAEFAKDSTDGARIVPPMLTFCIGFADFLRALLALPLSSSGFAGHVGDHWRRFAPVYLGDTLQTRFKPLSVRTSTSRPERCVVQFGLQLVNQHERVVQEGETIMLMPTGPDA